MRKSGYRTTIHIYLIFFLSLLGAILVTAGLVFLLITIQRPDGSTARSDWPVTFASEFRDQIIFIDGAPQIRQAGMEQLQENGVGLQVIDASGNEVVSYQKPAQARDSYSGIELWQLSQARQLEDGQTTVFIGNTSHEGKLFAYLLYFPIRISKITMFLNGDRFTGGKTVLITLLCILCLAVLVAGVVYGVGTTRAMKRMTDAVRDISLRRYRPVPGHGAYQDLYDSLNTLDAEIRSSDQLRRQTEMQRREWIANITHDLKTPLSPIKGYAEILQETGSGDQEQCKRYGELILKNASYLEMLIQDLKLTYQLENGMLPVNRQALNLIRFLKEVAIDILNDPAYQNRVVHFESQPESIQYPFDPTLLKRAFHNIIVNAFVHGAADTEVTLQISLQDSVVTVLVADNGKGMNSEALDRLFDRYYRGGSTAQKPEGTGLGLAIAKSIVELHGGTIAVSSIPGQGTTFQIDFPLLQVT